MQRRHTMNVKRPLLTGVAVLFLLAAHAAAQNQLPAVQGPNGPVSADPIVQVGFDTITNAACVPAPSRPTCQLIAATVSTSPFTVVGTSTPITTGASSANTALVAATTV